VIVLNLRSKANNRKFPINKNLLGKIEAENELQSEWNSENCVPEIHTNKLKLTKPNTIINTSVSINY
jgi:hypothetical protein